MAHEYGIIDLHMHSTVSDGTDSPAELLEKVRAAGIGLFALTDHDSFDGCVDVCMLLQPGDPAFLTGVEFSCRDEYGKYHILGYGFDFDSAPIRQVVDKGHTLRLKKVQARLDFLAEKYGFRFSDGDLRRLHALKNPGKPHIGNLMVKYGYATDKETAIRDFIDKMRVRSEYVRPDEAIAGILGSGGIPVLAHPTYGSGDQLILGEEMAQRIGRLKAFGLQGVEAFYSGFTPKITREVLSFAEQFDLYATAGSDYHGGNKLVELADTGLDLYGEAPGSFLRFLDAAQPRMHRGR
ncbi:MAG: PHP domain-containing protein [Oscillospiraceae bacterium]|nr:PHP domain-containing protein [Oscillospiraceae bacterium]